MKRKITRCAIEAGVVSIGIHLLLLFFAGSVVVWRVAHRQATAFKSENFQPPKPADRALQLPVKVQLMQKKGSRPKVTSRVVSAAASHFTLPSMEVPDASFKLADNGEALQSLNSRGLPGGLDLGVTGVNFFGTRSKGEKMVFILDASRQMMEDAKGGYYTYKYAKDKIHRLVDAMPAATLFNVMAYNDSSVDMFRPQPVPATQANRDALKTWIALINSDPHSVGKVSSNYRSTFTYKSDIGGRARHWLKAVQAAMEQTADNIFVLCAGFGRYSASSARSDDPPGEVERDEKRLAEYREKVAAVNERALKAFNAENTARAKKGLPPKIVYDWNDYMTQELRLVMPDPPPSTGAGGGGGASPPDPGKLVLDHMDAVVARHYTPQKIMPPRVHFVYLVAADASLSEGYIDLAALEKTADAFRGDFELLRGAKTMKNLIRYNPDSKNTGD